MARLTAAQRRALPKSDFLVPSKAPGPGSFPVPDAGHMRSAIGHSGAAANPAAIKSKARAMLHGMHPGPAHRTVDMGAGKNHGPHTRARYR